MDITFETALQEMNQAYLDAVVFDDWQPTPGEYIVLLGKCRSGTKLQDDGSLRTWWALPGTLISQTNPAIDGREFTVLSLNSKIIGRFRSAVTTLNNGIMPPNTLEAHAVLERAEGQVVRVKVAKDSGKGKNASMTFNANVILEVIDTRTVPAAASAVAAQAAAKAKVDAEIPI